MNPRQPHTGQGDTGAARRSGGSWTVRALLTWTAAYFQEAGVDTPRLDAEVLLAHAMECSRLDLYLHHGETVCDPALVRYRSYVRRRRRREPVAYITGVREFYSLPFEVGPGVLIPRPETEHLVEYVLERAGGRDAAGDGAIPVRILDLCTGAGNIAVALAHNLPQAWIVAADVSRAALGFARRNAGSLAAASRSLHLVRGHLLAWLRPGARGFDFVVANPPYVPTGDLGTLPPEVREHEPTEALLGGPRGTSLAERILHAALPHLRDGGSLVMEIGEGQSETLHRTALQEAGYDRVEILRDYGGHPRVLAARKAGGSTR